MLTHKTVQYKLAEYMEANGWKREHSNHNLVIGGISDEVFVSEDNQELHAEVKPENIGVNVIWLGIGQTVRVLAEPNRELKTILVCFIKHAEVAKKVLLAINSKMIGLLAYDQNGEFIPVINVWGTRDNSWITEKGTYRKEIIYDSITVPILVEENIVYGETELECLRCEHKWKAQKRRISYIKRYCPKCGTAKIQIKGLVK